MDPIAAVSHKDIPPDPSIMDAVGTHHELPTALADLVDNAIDAHARHVHVRFLTRDGVMIGLLVVDDGSGMDDACIDAAMTFARRRDYGTEDLGHYGLGLKAASLSQADILEVCSRTAGGAPVGRRITKNDSSRVETLDPGQVAGALDDLSSRIPESISSHGTIIRWWDMRTVLTSPDTEERAAWLTSLTERVRAHLGLVFNRLLARRLVAITIDEFDIGIGEAGAIRKVNALDPLVSSRRGPARITLNGNVHGIAFELQATILTRRTLKSSEVAASARASRSHRGQGLYIYRHDRLLQMGGWGALVREDRDREYLRLAFDLGDDLISHAQINPEKNGVVLSADIRKAMQDARSDEGVTLSDLLERGRETAKNARARRRRPIFLIEPGRGLSRSMHNAIDTVAEFSDSESIDIRWRELGNASLTVVDLNNRTLWLNGEYRRILSGSTDPEDAPLLKMLLLLIYSRYFERCHLGDRAKREIAAWDELLRAAMGEELERRGLQEGRTSE